MVGHKGDSIVSSKSKRICAQCTHFQGAYYGECHRYPPTTQFVSLSNLGENNTWEVKWPRVCGVTDTCGEFTRKLDS